MERLEVKKIKGKNYYYYSKWGWEDGKCRRLWQRYLGTGEAVIQKLNAVGENPSALYAEISQFGAPIALWNESHSAKLIEIVDMHCEKRDQGLSLGQYIALAAINRAYSAVSKQGMWEWFSKTSLVRLLPGCTESSLSSQHFWNNLERFKPEDCQKIWGDLIKGVIHQEKIDLSSILYDGTNYYTFIDTFNARCSLAKRGKNKQGRSNLRQINYSLFCTANGHIPLLYDVYEGNQNDYTHFPLALEKFQNFFKGMVDGESIRENTTLIFDKGNCSKNNFKEIDCSGFYYVTSTKLDEHKELTSTLNSDKKFTDCAMDLDRTRAFRVEKIVHEKKRIVVVTYNENLFESQWKTLQADIEKAVIHLTELRQKLLDRKNGLVKKGKVPTLASIKSQCKEILSRDYLKDIIAYTVTLSEDLPQLDFSIKQDKLQLISETDLGKNILISNRESWTNEEIIRGYRSQYMIEEIFKESKDRKTGNWWPQHHWTDSKIHVHALYCTIALLLRSIMKKRVEAAGVKISMKRLLTELEDVREVVNIYAENKGVRKHSEAVLSKLSETQKTICSILKLSLDEQKKQVRG